jgi:hypothetical protein
MDLLFNSNTQSENERDPFQTGYCCFQQVYQPSISQQFSLDKLLDNDMFEVQTPFDICTRTEYLKGGKLWESACTRVMAKLSIEEKVIFNRAQIVVP